jgi:hypothetical protein
MPPSFHSTPDAAPDFPMTASWRGNHPPGNNETKQIARTIQAYAGQRKTEQDETSAHNSKVLRWSKA